jgi:hypothetical protein
MDVIYIKRQDSGQFVIPAVGIASPEGKTRYVPHPFGSQTMVFEVLEKVLDTIHRAGYAAEYEGIHYPAPTRALVKRAATTPPPPDEHPLQTALHHALPELRLLLKDMSPVVVSQAVAVLGELHDKVSLQPLVQCLAHDDASVRKNAGEALAHFGQEGITALRQALLDKNWVVRNSAVAALLACLQTQPESVPDLLNQASPLFHDDNWLVRSQLVGVYAEVAKWLKKIDT